MQRRVLTLVLTAAIAAVLAQDAFALRHEYPERFPGHLADQGDVVRLPNVGQQVRYSIVIRDVIPVITMSSRHLGAKVHPAERDDHLTNNSDRTSFVPAHVLPSGPARAAIRIFFGGWIGGGALHPDGRLDLNGSFMPATMPVRVRWVFDKRAPAAFGARDGARQVDERTIEFDLPALKIYSRSTAYVPFDIPSDMPAQGSQCIVLINGHELKPLAIRFNGGPIVIPEYRSD